MGHWNTGVPGKRTIQKENVDFQLWLELHAGHSVRLRASFPTSQGIRTRPRGVKYGVQLLLRAHGKLPPKQQLLLRLGEACKNHAVPDVSAGVRITTPCLSATERG